LLYIELEGLCFRKFQTQDKPNLKSSPLQIAKNPNSAFTQELSVKKIEISTIFYTMLQNPFIPQNKAGFAILRRVSNNQVEVHMRLCSSHQHLYTILTTVKAEAKQYKIASKTSAILKVMEKT